MPHLSCSRPLEAGLAPGSTRMDLGSEGWPVAGPEYDGHPTGRSGDLLPRIALKTSLSVVSSLPKERLDHLTGTPLAAPCQVWSSRRMLRPSPVVVTDLISNRSVWLPTIVQAIPAHRV